MTGNPRTYALLHFIVLIWGFSGIFGMLISVPAVEVVFYRVTIATAALLVFMLWKKKNFLEDYGSVTKQLMTGGLVAIHWILFFLSARVSNVSVCLAGMATCSLWTALIEPFYYKRKVKPVDLVLSIMAVAGMVVIFNVEFKYWLGLLLAIISAIICSVFTVINAHFIDQKKDPVVITFYEMAGAALFVLLFFPFYSQMNGGLNLQLVEWDFLWIGLLSLVCTVYAYTVSVKIMDVITPYVMNLTVNLEPIYGIILAVLIFGSKESMSFGFYIGTGLILLAVLSYPIINKLQRRKPLENRHTIA